MQSRSVLQVACVVLMLASFARGQMIVGDGAILNTIDDKAVRTALKEYAEAIAKGDRAKAETYYSITKEFDRKLVRLFVETDIKIEALHQMIEKKFDHDTWVALAPLLGGHVENQIAKAKVRADDDSTFAIVDLFPESPDASEDRWFGEIPMEKTATGWKFQDIDKAEPGTRLIMRRWHRDVAGELTDLTHDIEIGKIEKREVLANAVRKLVSETLSDEVEEDNDDPTTQPTTQAANL